MNWDDAMKCCSFGCEGAHLVYIESEQENMKVSSLVFEVVRPANEHWWIGLSDREEEGSWKWGDVPVTYENWRKNEPNNSGAGEDCGELKSRNGDNAFWNDESCNSLRHFICEKDMKADT
ncbi:Collectin-12 [Holothuria leucospilota]|uniref:Collectin-12 n=1 Tax=Holothuria leucospilota TaxID=206669 RepID=A0A9Q1BSN5_HOLLE|nr:Collectin-12 [Holothuria leucospilota]